MLPNPVPQGLVGTPDGLNDFVICPSYRTLAWTPYFDDLTIFSGTPWCLKIFQSMSRSVDSKAFSKSTETIYSPVFHSRVCSTMILTVANPACSSRNLWSRASFILFTMILQSILLAHVRSMMLLQFLQRVKSPFLISLTREPTFQSWGMASAI